MSVIPVSSILDIDELSYGSVELFIAALAREYARRGDILDLETRTLNLDLLNKDQRAFLLNSVKDGHLIMPYEDFIPRTQTPYEINLDFLNFKDLFYTTDEGFAWSLTHAKDHYRDDYGIESSKALNVPYIVLALAAKHFIDYRNGLVTAPLTFFFDILESTTASNYLSLVLSSELQPGIAEAIHVSHSLPAIDYDFLYFISRARDRGTYRTYSVDEKLEILNKEDFRPGGIYVLWNRGPLSESNQTGKVTKDPILVRFDGVTLDRYGHRSFNYTAIPDLDTLEERSLRYTSMREDIRQKYMDLLDAPNVDKFYKESVNLLDLGIGSHLHDEVLFVDKFDHDESLTRILQWYTKQGESVVGEVNLSASEFIYWVLNQWGFQFDKELYRHNYELADVEPLYDIMISRKPS